MSAPHPRRWFNASPSAFCLFPLAVLALAACRSNAEGDENRGPRGHAVPQRGYDVEHYSLDLTLLPSTRSIEGQCVIRLVPTRAGLAQIVLDLEGLEVHGVRDGDGRALEFERAGDELTVRPAEPLAEEALYELEVSYGGAPVTGLWFSGTRPDGFGPTQVFTQGQAEESRGWFPCFDHLSDRATSELRLTMPSNWISMAPGERIDVQEQAGTRTEHWSMTTPHPCYLTSLVAGELEIVEEEWEGMPLYYLAEAAYVPWLEASFGATGDMLSFLSDYTGVRYPYAKYSQACIDNFPWGGMENVSATTLTPLTLDDERGQRDQQSTDLVVHEAAHQWFGDLFTCADWSHLWLNEGFATYMEVLYAEHAEGLDEARILMRDYLDAYLEEDASGERRATVSQAWTDPEDIMDTRIYEGAAARLHLLRFLVGDEAFRAGVRGYAQENAGRDVLTEDLRHAMEAASGRNLALFFDEWIYRPGHPEFDVSWEWNAAEASVSVVVEQVQSERAGTPAVYHVPVEIEVVSEGGSSTQRVDLASRRQVCEIASTGRPLYVRFDKHGWIPKRVRYERRPSQWLAIARDDDDVNARRDAVRRLGELAGQARARGERELVEPLVAELVNRLRRDGCSAVRVTAAEALGLAGGLEARERLIVAARHDEHAPVRAAALRALGAFGESRPLAEVAQVVFDEGYSWDTMAAAAQLMTRADPQQALAWLSAKLLIPSPHDQLRGSLLRVLGELPGESVTDLLRRWAADEGTHPNARAAAVRQLASRPGGSRSTSEFLAGFLGAQSFRLRGAAVDGLIELDDATAYAALEEYYPQARTSGERRAIERLLRGGS